MKLDLHCHTKEGSMDGKVTIEDYILKLADHGYQGMLVTDHNSYQGYRAFKNSVKDKIPEGFVVLRGIEYDTIDAGHILVIMPEDVNLKLMECRGLRVKKLIEIVHRYGGILGPAHPCGEKHMSFCATPAYRKFRDILGQFDFLEGYNSCESDEVNEGAQKLAEEFDLVQFGGSDSHKIECVGTAYTKIEEDITCESDLIRYVKNHGATQCGGFKYTGTVKERIGFFSNVLAEGFWFYNRFASMYRHRRRVLALQIANTVK